MKSIFSTLFIVFLLTTSDSVFSQENKTVKEIPDGNALVYFFRPSARGFAEPYPIYCDTIHLGTLRAKHYYYYYIPEGEHSLISKKGRKNKEINLVLKAGESYYFMINGMANISIIENQKEVDNFIKNCNNSNEKSLLEEGIVKFK